MRKGISKWIIAIVSLLSLSGVYLVFSHVKKNQEISKNAEIQSRKEELEKEITKLKSALHNNEVYLTKKKQKEEPEEGIKWIDFWEMKGEFQNYSDETVQNLEKERGELYKKCRKLNAEYNDWARENNQEIYNKKEKAKKWWSIQKDDSWEAFVSPLVADQTIWEKFDLFIKKFYWKFREEEGMPEGSLSPEIPFTGFGGFNTSEKREMGHCACHIQGWRTSDGTEYERVDDMKIIINPKYLLNKGKYGTNEFICEDPAVIPNYKYIGIGFDNDENGENDLIGTIAHELAHAIQNCKQYLKNGKTFTQCYSSGDGIRDSEDKLIEAEYPEVVDEHTGLWKKFKTMIMNSAEYSELKNWWTN